METRSRYPIILAGLVVLCLVISAIDPYNRGTWLMEVAPALIALPILAVTYRRFPLTPLLYMLIALHASVLILGGAYTYARVPLGFWMQEVLAIDRNPYDKIGHFMQGFVPAMVARELFLRKGYLTNRRMTAFLAICVSMAISAWYELVEWGAAVALGEGADQFLGTQGDVWDTQSDMLMAFIGAIAALALLSRWHDRQIEKLAGAITAQRPASPTSLPR